MSVPLEPFSEQEGGGRNTYSACHRSSRPYGLSPPQKRNTASCGALQGSPEGYGGFSITVTYTEKYAEGGGASPLCGRLVVRAYVSDRDSSQVVGPSKKPAPVQQDPAFYAYFAFEFQDRSVHGAGGG